MFKSYQRDKNRELKNQNWNQRTSLNNTKKQRKFNIVPYGGKFYLLTCWYKI